MTTGSPRGLCGHRGKSTECMIRTQQNAPLKRTRSLSLPQHYLCSRQSISKLHPSTAFVEVGGGFNCVYTSVESSSDSATSSVWPWRDLTRSPKLHYTEERKQLLNWPWKAGSCRICVPIKSSNHCRQLFYFSVSVCTYMSVCVGRVGAQATMYMWMSEVSLRCWALPSILFETESLVCLCMAA